MLIGNPKEFKFLKESVLKAEGLVANLITARATEETVTAAKAVKEAEEVFEGQSMVKDDIPF